MKRTLTRSRSFDMSDPARGLNRRTSGPNEPLRMALALGMPYETTYGHVSQVRAIWDGLPAGHPDAFGRFGLAALLQAPPDQCIGIEVRLHPIPRDAIDGRRWAGMVRDLGLDAAELQALGWPKDAADAACPAVRYSMPAAPTPPPAPCTVPFQPEPDALLEVVRAHPGGVRAVAIAMGVSMARIYQATSGTRHCRVPHRFLRRLADAIDADAEVLAELWRIARESRGLYVASNEARRVLQPHERVPIGATPRKRYLTRKVFLDSKGNEVDMGKRGMAGRLPSSIQTAPDGTPLLDGEPIRFANVPPLKDGSRLIH